MVVYVFPQALAQSCGAGLYYGFGTTGQVWLFYDTQVQLADDAPLWADRLSTRAPDHSACALGSVAISLASFV